MKLLLEMQFTFTILPSDQPHRLPGNGTKMQSTAHVRDFSVDHAGWEYSHV